MPCVSTKPQFSRKAALPSTLEDQIVFLSQEVENLSNYAIQFTTSHADLYHMPGMKDVFMAFHRSLDLDLRNNLNVLAQAIFDNQSTGVQTGPTTDIVHHKPLPLSEFPVNVDDTIEEKISAEDTPASGTVSSTATAGTPSSNATATPDSCTETSPPIVKADPSPATTPAQSPGTTSTHSPSVLINLPPPFLDLDVPIPGPPPSHTAGIRPFHHHFLWPDAPGPSSFTRPRLIQRAGAFYYKSHPKIFWDESFGPKPASGETVSVADTLPERAREKKQGPSSPGSSGSSAPRSPTPPGAFEADDESDTPHVPDGKQTRSMHRRRWADFSLGRVVRSLVSGAVEETVPGAASGLAKSVKERERVIAEISKKVTVGLKRHRDEEAAAERREAEDLVELSEVKKLRKRRRLVKDVLNEVD